MIKSLLVLFGFFDFISFIRTYKFGLKLLDGLCNLHGIPLFGFAFHVVEISLIASLLISGTLLMHKRESGLMVYYFQFVFKLACMILTFGFLLTIFDISFNSFGYKLLVFIVITLEFVRLILTIIIHRIPVLL